jgi:CheY-like chemotaxis protein
VQACAYIVGPEDGSGAVLRKLARQVGFATVHPYKGVAAAEQQAQVTPLVYFLFSAVQHPRAHKSAAEAIRLSSARRVRFSPMIYFSENPSLESIRSCIGMGFDDVITLPFTLARIEERLDRQVERTLIYYQTDTYFGPDRRGRTEDEEVHSGRGSGGQYRRLEILRSTSAGVNVLKDDLHVVL